MGSVLPFAASRAPRAPSPDHEEESEPLGYADLLKVAEAQLGRAAGAARMLDHQGLKGSLAAAGEALAQAVAVADQRVGRAGVANGCEQSNDIVFASLGARSPVTGAGEALANLRRWVAAGSNTHAG